jgi:hypothetical protein
VWTCLMRGRPVRSNLTEPVDLKPDEGRLDNYGSRRPSIRTPTSRPRQITAPDAAPAQHAPPYSTRHRDTPNGQAGDARACGHSPRGGRGC